VKNWRVLVAVAAVVLAGAAAYLSYEYAHKADTRAEKNVQTVSVLVAKGDISKGTSAAQALDSGLISSKSIARGVLPPTVVQNASDLTNKVAGVPIAKGQFIVGDSFVLPAQVGGFSSTVPKGMQAITISVDATHGVAGFVQPGDMVNLLWAGPVTDQQGGTQGDSARITAFLVPSVKVMAIGSTTANSAPASNTSVGASTSGQAAGGASNSSGNTGLMTFAVTPRQAEQIVQGTSLGDFYLTLDAPGTDPSKFTPPAEIVETWNLFDQHLGTVDSFRNAKAK